MMFTETFSVYCENHTKDTNSKIKIPRPLSQATVSVFKPLNKREIYSKTSENHSSNRASSYIYISILVKVKVIFLQRLDATCVMLQKVYQGAAHA
jgi:hypothetical protein